MEFLSKHKRIFFISAVIMCILLAILTVMFRTRPTLVEGGLGYIIVPMQKASTALGRWASSKINFFTNLSNIEETNKSLSQRVEELEMEITRLRIVEKENEKLSALLEIDQKYADYPKLGAEIIAKDMGNWYDRFTIDKGSNDGLEKNMVVIASGGLVGIISESGSNYSKVISLIDFTSSVSAKSVRTDDIGYVKGDLELMANGHCRMELIDLAAEIMEGDEIVTSQLGNIYPPGITIGTVSEIRLDDNGLTKYAIIIPSVDFKHLETVLIINERWSD